MDEKVKAGDTIPVRFQNTTLPDCRAVVERVDGPFLDIRYVDGVFAGVRWLLRVPGWTIPHA